MHGNRLIPVTMAIVSMHGLVTTGSILSIPVGSWHCGPDFGKTGKGQYTHRKAGWSLVGVSCHTSGFVGSFSAYMLR